MAHALKHTILILFIGLLLFNTGGSLIFFKLREAAIEASFKKALANNELIGNVAVVEFTDVELQNAEWEDEHEVKLNGHFYDILKVEYKDGHKVYSCFADDDETALYTWYNQHKKHQLENGADDDNLAPVFSNIFVYKIQHIAFLSIYLQTINTLCHLSNTQVVPIPTAPPPKA